MKKRYVILLTPSEITEVVDKSNLVQGDVIFTRGAYSVDGKSLIGVFSLNPMLGVTVEYPEEDKNFDNFISQFE